MPVLDLTPEMIGPNRTRLSLAYIEAVMLWPHDEVQQAEAIRTSTATFILNTLNSTPTVGTVADAGEWIDWVNLLAEAMPLRIIQRQAQQPYVHGLIIGELLAATVGQYSSGEPVKLQSLKHEIRMLGKKRAAASSHFRMSASTLENIWKRYKPVSHLWAAYVQSTASSRNGTFPCALKDLQVFLQLSECFRREGELIKLTHRGDRLLMPGAQWGLPPSITLPAVRIEFDDRSTRP